MDTNAIALELLDEQNYPQVREIRRADVSEAFVDTVDTIMLLTQYGKEHGCIGHTYAIRYGDVYIGVILLGEAIPWDTDPLEMQGVPFYRLMGFVLDSRYRGAGIGSYVLETVISRVYEEFGVRPIALGCHQDNRAAARFYERHGFVRTDAMEGSDRYYLRYPNNRIFRPVLCLPRMAGRFRYTKKRRVSA
ncbi:MAG: GNAT family N-acetyltransferase [Clostridia bacterium]|nr:GNAT family N-acetyltransferase [Clostridia bacterium]